MGWWSRGAGNRQSRLPEAARQRNLDPLTASAVWETYKFARLCARTRVDMYVYLLLPKGVHVCICIRTLSWASRAREQLGPCHC